MELSLKFQKKPSFLIKDWEIILISCILMPLLAFVSPYIAIAIMWVLGLYFLFTSNYKFLVYFLCLILVQNITLLAFANRFTPTTNTIFSLSKEVMLYIFVAKNILFGKYRRNSMIVPIFFAIFFTTYVLISLVTSSADIYSKILSIRQIYLPFVCFFFGFFTVLEKEEKTKLFNLIVSFGVFVAILGFIDYFILKDSVWSTLPIRQYQYNKGIDFDIYNGVFINFYTWDFRGITGRVERRLVSIFCDPMITGHFLFMCFVLVNLSTKRRKLLLKIIFLVSSLLTLSKGVFVSYLALILIVLIKHVSYQKFKVTLFVISFLAFVAFPIVTTIINNMFPNTSIVIHLNGFISGITNSTLLGEGIGKAGVMVSAKTDIDRLTGESYIGVISSQLGYIGLATYLLFTISIILLLFKSYQINKNKIILASLILFFAVFVESFFSESSVGIIATGFYFIFTGLATSISIKKEENNHVREQINQEHQLQS